MATTGAVGKGERGPETLARKLRSVIEERGMTAFRLGKDSGVDAGVIQRFLNRERGLTLATVEKLAEVLGLRLVEGGPGPGRPRGRGRPRAVTAKGEEA